GGEPEPLPQPEPLAQASATTRSAKGSQAWDRAMATTVTRCDLRRHVSMQSPPRRGGCYAPGPGGNDETTYHVLGARNRCARGRGGLQQQQRRHLEWGRQGRRQQQQRK